MAVAGLQNVSVLDSSFHRESQSPISRRWANQDRPSNGPSSLLRMWRDLEGEHLVTHPQSRLEEQPPQHESNESNIEFVTTFLSEGDSQGQMGPQNEHEDNSSYSSELSTDFGEIERERVRQIFREWTNSGLRGHETNGSRMSNCSRSQLLGENERERVRVVREWVEMTTQQRGTSRGDGEEQQDAEIGSQIARVRDGLVVNHCEIGCRRTIRKLCGRQALIDLLARAERERKWELQCLLENRPVSDFSHRNRIQSLLRGRFLRNKGFVQDERSTTSLAASELGLLRERHTVSGLREGFLTRADNFAPSPLGSDQSDTSSIDDMNGHINEQTHANTFETGPDEITDPSQSTNNETDTNLSTTDSFENTGQSINLQESIAHVEERQEQEQVSSVENVVNEWSQEPLGTEGNAQGTIQEASEVLHEHDNGAEAEADSEERLVQGQIGHLEASVVDDFDWEDMSAQEEEWQDSGEWRENTEEMDSQENSHQWYQETRGNDDIGHSDLQELHQEWHENDVADVESVVVNERVNTFYFPEDDNQSNLELRELLSRRRVSNLLQSGFRESLDQLIQSYVQRQSHASLEWEQEMEGEDQNSGELDSIERAPLDIPPPPVTPLTLWDQDSHDDATWQRPNGHQRSVNEWEIINELRMEMARLQQRMNNMQRLLEECMEMQLELQRSVRQEVSAALNRSSDSSEACGDSSLEDESKWDHVRKGICCICCDSNINSLLYRCGHMCTCSKCADNLVQGSGKCPMCRAPVVEVIRAYSIM